MNITDGEIAKKIAEMFDLRPKAISSIGNAAMSFLVPSDSSL